MTREKIFEAAMVLLVALCVILGGCKKKGGTEVVEPGGGETETETGGGGEGLRPVVPVPPLNEYGWLATANIKLGRESEISAVEAKIENYYSGYPTFLKILKLITKDRNVGLKDNPAYLTDVFSKYYELIGADPADPFLAVTDFDTGVLKNALFLSWKKQNEFTSVDNYDDMVTSVNYGK
jgi:hypothetical protein